MHQTIVIGNLGRDPEIKKFENGGQVANFSVGVTERGYKKSDGTEREPHTEWYRCVAYNSIANFIGTYCKKGHKVQITCRKHTRKYTDQNGTEKEREEFIVSNVEHLTPKDKRNEPTIKEDPITPPEEDTFEEKKDDLPF